MKTKFIKSGILLLSIIIIICLFEKPVRERFATKNKLFLMPESLGFNVPEMEGKSILPNGVAQKYFSSVVVCANSADYVAGDPKKVMQNQWEDSRVKNLNIPVEKWAFVCCNGDRSAKDLVPSLIKDYPDITGFLIDYEDPKSVIAFCNVFAGLPSGKYQYGLVGYGSQTTWDMFLKKNNITSPQIDYFFNEVYTEGELGKTPNSFYDKGKPSTSGNAICPAETSSSVINFWRAAAQSGNVNGTNIIPTVCGSGDCQELMYSSTCFDERISADFISQLLATRKSVGTVSGGNFAIWYGTGQSTATGVSCWPTNQCNKLDKTTCENWQPSNYTGTPNPCRWIEPTATKKGVCIMAKATKTQKGINWGCSKDW